MHDEATLEAMREAVEALAVQAGAVSDLSASPLRSVLGGDWSPQWETHLVEGAETLTRTARDLRVACAAFANAVGFDCPTLTPGCLDALVDLAQVLRESHRRQTACAFGPDGAERLEALDQAVTHLRDYLAAQRDLSVPFDPMAWRELDGDALARRWAAARETWWPKRVFLKGRIRKEMRRLGNTAGKPDPEHDAPVLARLRRHGEAIARLGPILEAVKGWRGHDSAPDDMERLRDLGQRARQAAGRLADDATALTALRARLRDLLHDGNDLLAADAPVGVVARSLDQTMDAYREAQRAFDRQRGAASAGTDAAAAPDLDAMADMAEGIAGARAELREWCAWRRRRAQAIDLDLMPMVEALEAGRIDPRQARDVFEAAYCAWWATAIIGEDEVLRTFSTAEHEATILRFREVDETFQALTAAYIVARLRGDMPDQETVTRGSQWGILNRELQKKARHKPVRQLVQEIPDVLGTLAPCLMMSPLSVAQYLPAEQTPFDVVVFDEASQITVWDAVGAIARGRQLIVAGDPKQMPPTTFFDRSDDDIDGDIETDVTLESILDEMRGASIPERVLYLHYRSRRESLIAFSNSRYYEDQLVTFPAPAVRDHGVTLVRTEGHYARGKARHNEGEARAVVDEVVGRLTHPDETVRALSIGVVTFNSEQQTLIENLLDEARGRQPEIEWAFAAEGIEEPVFVKNLETVQGDERDVILFSITYGPDRTGHMTMNFGPLNKQGGERRLNVALTRARYAMTVFSSLAPERIDLSRTQARAVTDLKHFLEFAERGPSALGSAVFGSVGDVESPFESAVLRALRERGWEVHPQIGVSRYRVDLGVVHPDEPGFYLAGIECDGAMYHSAANARERDKIRQAVLENLGWTLFRIWSTDWWHHADAALETVDTALKAHLETDRARRAEAAAAKAEAEAKAMAEAEAEAEAQTETETAAPAGTGSTGPVETHGTARNTDLFSDVGPLDAPAAQRPLAAADRSPADLETTVGSADSPAPPRDAGSLDVARTYVVSSFDAPDLSADPETFYDGSYDGRLAAMVRHVVDTEGPIHEDILIRRIARHHGFKRTGRLIRERVLEVAGDHAHPTTEDAGVFYWAKAPDHGQSAPARCQGRDDDVRSVDCICAAELRSINADLDLMGDPVAVARAIGLARLSQSARERLERVLA
jgi:very-short-patch-repair endonuclease